MTIPAKTPPIPDGDRDLVVQFLAELLRATIDARDQEAFQTALQTYCDGLRPWLVPSDAPAAPRAVFSLLEHASFDEEGDHVSVVLSAEAEALFRAWRRRNAAWLEAGVGTAYAWSN